MGQDAEAATSATLAATALTLRSAMQHVLQASPPAAMVPLRTVLVQVVALDAAAATSTTPAVTALTRRSAVLHHALQAAGCRRRYS